MTASLLADERPQARKAHRCQLCEGTIAPGDRYVAQRIADNDTIYTFRAHTLCYDLSWQYARECGLSEDDWIDPGAFRSYALTDWWTALVAKASGATWQTDLGAES